MTKLSTTKVLELGGDRLSYDEFVEYVNHLVEKEIPPVLLEGLNAGIHVNPGIGKDDEEKNYYVLGEYIHDSLGVHIALYYGSFTYFYGEKSEEKMKKEILSTIKHELIHHVESLAGQETLAYEEDIASAKRKKKKK